MTPEIAASSGALGVPIAVTMLPRPERMSGEAPAMLEPDSPVARGEIVTRSAPAPLMTTDFSIVSALVFGAPLPST